MNTDERRLYIQKHVRVFGMERIQELLTLLKFIESAGITIHELAEYKAGYMKDVKARLRMPAWWPPPVKSKDRRDWLKTLTISEREEYRKWRKTRLEHTAFGRKGP